MFKVTPKAVSDYPIPSTNDHRSVEGPDKLFYPTTYYFEDQLNSMAEKYEKYDKTMPFSRKRLGVCGECLEPRGLYTACILNDQQSDSGQISAEYSKRIYSTVKLLMGRKLDTNLHVRRVSGVSPCPSMSKAKSYRQHYLSDKRCMTLEDGYSELFARYENKLKIGKRFIELIDNKRVFDFSTTVNMIKATYSDVLVKQRPRAFVEMIASNIPLSLVHQSHKYYTFEENSSYKHVFTPPLNVEYNNNRLNHPQSIEVLDIVSQDRRFKKQAMIDVVISDALITSELYNMSTEATSALLKLELNLINRPLIMRNYATDKVGLHSLNFWPSGLHKTTLGNLVGSTIEIEDCLDFRQKTINYSISDEFFRERGYKIALFGDNIMLYGNRKDVAKAKDIMLRHVPSVYYKEDKFYDTADTFLGMIPIALDGGYSLVQNPHKLVEIFSPEHGVFEGDTLGFFKPNLAAGYKAKLTTKLALQEYDQFKFLNKIDYDQYAKYFIRNTGEIDRKQEFVHGSERQVFDEHYWLTYPSIKARQLLSWLI